MSCLESRQFTVYAFLKHLVFIFSKRIHEFTFLLSRTLITITMLLLKIKITIEKTKKKSFRWKNKSKLDFRNFITKRAEILIAPIFLLFGVLYCIYSYVYCNKRDIYSRMFMLCQFLRKKNK